MYKIFLGDKPDSKVVIKLDNIPLLRVPAHVLVGVGNKKERYKKYLDGAFKNTDLLNCLAHIHLLGLQKGDVSLVANIRYKDYHNVCIKNFIEENAEFLTSILPYVFPNEKIPKQEGAEATSEADQQLKDLQAGMMGANTGTMENPPAGLTSADMDIIKGLIAEDQAKQEAMIPEQLVAVESTPLTSDDIILPGETEVSVQGE